MKKNIFLALDFNSLDKALQITEKTKDYLAGIKIGLELYSVIGLDGLKNFEKFNLPIFLDTKNVGYNSYYISSFVSIIAK